MSQHLYGMCNNDAMEQFTSRLEPSGRILIPAVLRQKLGLTTGSEMVIEELEGVLTVQTRESAIRNVQKFFAQFQDGQSWSDELIEERRAEARRENRG
jgi:bifunctional DNA-binding transcriptional regulator/antitoxin component of YhaV-PrlF toxin-antitoxin module